VVITIGAVVNEVNHWCQWMYRHWRKWIAIATFFVAIGAYKNNSKSN
jgi:hypothetical protein